MADQKQIDVLLKAVLDAKGFEELQANLKKVAEKNKEAEQSSNKFADSLKEMGPQLLAMAAAAISVSAAFEYLKSSFHAAVEEEAGAFRLQAGLKGVAGASDEAAAGAAEFIEKLEIQTAISDDELRPALVRLAAATHDVGQAQNLLKIAADAANAGVGDFNTNIDKLTQFMEHGKVRGFDPMALALNDLSGKSVPEMNRGLQQMAARYAELAEKNETVEFQLRKNKIAWDNTKEAIGGTFASIGNQLTPALEVLAYTLGMVVGGARLVITAFENMLSSMVAMGKANLALVTGDFKGAWKIMQDNATSVAKRWEETSESVTDSLAKINLAFQGSGAVTGGQIKVKPGSGGGKGKEKDTAADAMERGLNDALAQEKRYAASREAVMQELARQDKERLKSVNANMGAEVKAIDAKEKAELRWAKVNAKTRKDALRIERDYWQQKLATTKRGTAEYIEVQSNFVEAQKALDAETVKSKEWEARMKWDTARSGLHAASKAFGGNKELAIAGIAMDTFSAAQSAYKAMAGIYPAPLWGVLAAAVAVADGAANMKGAEKAQPGGGGFDIAEHDMMAYTGGRRWADDMVRNWSQGVTAGWGEGMKGGGNSTVNNSTTYNNNKTNHVNVTGLGIMSDDDAQMRKFTRKLQIYMNQLEPERTGK